MAFSEESDVYTGLPPRQPADGDHAGRQDDAGDSCPAVDAPGNEEREWYPPPDTPCM
jgi:hypothetical protein